MFTIFWLIILFLNYKSRVESAIDVIGNYKQLNPKNCGISRLSPQVDTNCFEWHKELLPSLKNARNITVGEAPWMALLATNVSVTISATNETYLTKATCGGSLIGNQWILTAAHCLVGDAKTIINIEGLIEIFFGFDFHYIPSFESNISYKSNKWYIHPNYNKNDYFHRFDIGLIKLKKPINTTVYRIKSENNICLPERREQFNESEGVIEYGMTAAWSTHEPETPNQSSHLNYRLQMSYWRVNTITQVTSKGNLLYADKLDNQLICYGDSGSPLWQYHMGRAVIIGIHSWGIRISNITKCLVEVYANTTNVPIFATPVSLNIDWIMNVTELN